MTRALARLFARMTLFIVFLAIGRGEIRETEAVLCGVRGGLTGASSGDFLVLIGTHFELLHYSGSGYREPFTRSGFDKLGAEHLGAVWSVRYSTDDSGGAQLLRAVFMGRSDTEIQAATRLVRRVISLLWAGKVSQAYAFFDRDFQLELPLAQLEKQLSGYDFDPTIGFHGTVCFAIEARSADSVDVAVDPSCYGFGETSVVRAVRRGASWKISKFLKSTNPGVAAVF